MDIDIKLKQFHDILAILELRDPEYFTDKVRPLCLPRRGMILQYFDQIGTIAGWGGTGGNTKWAANLAEVDVTIFNNDICRKIMHIQGKRPWTLNKGFDTISE